MSIKKRKKIKLIVEITYYILILITSMLVFGGYLYSDHLHHMLQVLLLVAIIIQCVIYKILLRNIDIEIEDQYYKTKDIAQQNERDKELRQKQMQFIANITHELRTPLNAILGFSEILFDSPLSEENHSHVKSINQSGKLLLSIVNDMLDLTQAEVGKLDFFMECQNICEIVKQSVKMLRVEADKYEINMVENYSTDLALISCDSKRLKQILINLIGNAIKYTPNHGKIQIKQKIKSSRVQISIIDNGVGINTKNLDNILTMFGVENNNVPGRPEQISSGIGLPLAKKLIEIMHGHLEIYSNVDVGTKVIVSFPIVREEDV